MKNLKNLPPEERPAYGKRVNELREKIEKLFEEKRQQIQGYSNRKRWKK